MSSPLSPNSFCAEPEGRANKLLLSSSSTSYSVLEKIGFGVFGKVYRCRNNATREQVAVKIFTEALEKSDTNEVSILEAIGARIPDSAYTVQFFEQFEDKGMDCIVFEMLDKSFYDFMESDGWRSMGLQLIRPIAMQLLLALDALSVCEILHADIKPDNIMFVDTRHQCMDLKLIDFGNAMKVSDVEPGMLIQAIGYRAPEITLGLPFTQAVDVWGVGCVLAFLFLAQHPFPIHFEYEMMKSIVEILGQPEDHLLQAGIYTEDLFIEEGTADGPTWRLMLPEEYSETDSKYIEQENYPPEQLRALADLLGVSPMNAEDYNGEREDRKAFVDLLKRLLYVDGDQRVSAREALQHPFITMDHLVKRFDDSDYVEISKLYMGDCQTRNSRGTSSSASPSSYHRLSDVEDPEVCPSDGEIRTISAPWYLHEEQHALLDTEGSGVGSADGEAALLSTTCYSQEYLSLNSYEEEPFTSDEGPCQCSEVEALSARSSGGVIVTDVGPDVSASSGRPRKWLKRMNGLFRGLGTLLCHCRWPGVAD